MRIKRIAIDLDGVVYDTIGRICKLYNTDFQYYPHFTPVNPNSIKSWDFDELVLADRSFVNMYFCQPRFFEDLNLMRSASWIIGKLSKEFEIVFVSSGRPANLRLKKEWIDQNFPYATMIGVDITEHEDKSMIDLSDAFFIDDCYKNLATSNAIFKVCYGKIYPWNKEWNGVRCENWSEIYGLVRKVVKGET